VLVRPAEIRQILTTLNLSQAAFARSTGVSRSYISRLLRGERANPSKLFTLHVVHLCRAHGLTDLAAEIDSRVSHEP